MHGVVIAGTSSGVGKTVATLAVVTALEEAGHTVQPAKAGPDFIDPSHHEQATGTASRTLDTWLQGPEGVRRNYARGDGDVCVVEGMMGLYDGTVCSTASVAEALGLPVVLAVDGAASMESVAATALGFARYAEHADRDIEVTGIVAQRAHGGQHERGIRDALPEGLAYLGRIPPDEGLDIPDRHLGLEMGTESPTDPEALSAASAHVRTDAVLEATQRAQEPTSTPTPPADPDHFDPATAGDQSSHRAHSKQRVAVAQDDAFCFCYPATIERLREQADVVPFAPTAGEELPACAGVYLPGGYPELHAEALTAGPAIDQLATAAAGGLPILGECGGMMVLAETLSTAAGETYEMAGVLPVDVSMHERYQALDHVQLRAREETLTADAGQQVRGHEFHYSSATVGADAQFAFDVERGEGIADGRDGLTEYRTVGTYCHVHPESGAFDRFLDAL
jgi:cobyrinic acid a,c-diamide synthase